MKRILMILAVAALMVTMWALTAVPAFAAPATVLGATFGGKFDMTTFQFANCHSSQHGPNKSGGFSCP